MDIRAIHEELFSYLTNAHLSDPGFTFTFRKSNRGGKLEQGYWFYGNENYLAISFWSGMDWKNKTPNIFFVILNDGSTYLEIAVSDSDDKRDFIEKYFSNSELGIRPEGKRYIREYKEFDKSEYMNSLISFLKRDKYTIDNIIRQNQSFFSNKQDVAIGFIDNNEFEAWYQKVLAYRNNEVELSERNFFNTLSGFRIQNFGPIKDTGFIEMPGSIQWVFLTGENGTGKTSILKSLASTICHTKVDSDDSDFKVMLQVSDIDKYYDIFERTGNEGIRKRRPLLKGFCAYGASRLKTSHGSDAKFSLKKALSKEGLTSSLFDSDTILIDIQHQLSVWKRDAQKIEIVEKRKQYIEELLVDLLPKVYRIKFSHSNSWESTEYIEKDANGNELPPVSFDQLASGLKSLVAMIGDMMMRLFNQQPDRVDPSELEGVVLIDEIDIHLHPVLQKYLVEQLTATFPRVQFIASTHSPIPLLGAPFNSMFFKVERDNESGVGLVDLTSIRVAELLPNAILSSDLFGMNQLFSRALEASQVKTEDYFKEIELNEAVRTQLREIANRLRDNIT